MRTIFVDAFFWIATINPKDDWYDRVIAVSESIEPCKLITTDEVLTEVMNFYANSGSFLRNQSVQLIDAVRKNPKIEVRPQTRQSALDGEALYKERPDKGYSLTDCISMNTMKQLGVVEVLTRDKHFSQEGFIVLFKD